MTVQECYERYSIMPNLQLHQLRVAAVGKRIAASMPDRVHEEHIVLACLFHDMGNIIKSDLRYFSERYPDLVAADEVETYTPIKEQFHARYGNNEHDATLMIAKELSLPGEVLALIDSISFARLEETAATDSFDAKVVEYADLRVGPRGIMTLEERIAEAAERYRHRNSEMPSDEERFSRLCDAAKEVERQLFADIPLEPSDITETALAGDIEPLRSIRIA